LPSGAHHPHVIRTIVFRRLADAVVLLWLVITLVFVLVRLAPGDPVALHVPPTASAEDAARLRAEFGLDRPYAMQYGRWIGAVLKGDLGESFALRRPVARVLRDAAPVSIFLGTVSLLLTFAVGVPIGMWQAARRRHSVDRIVTVLTTFVYAAPSFWIALALVAVFTYGAATLGLPAGMRLPAFGLRTPGAELSGLAAVWDLLRHAVLPVTTLAAIGAAGIARYARTGVADILPHDFVRTAFAKGAGYRRVFGLHVLRAIAPQLAILFALSLPGIVAGSVFVESVFSWPGMGRAMLLAIQARDYPVVMGASLFFAATVIAANAIADLALPVIDPRRRQPGPREHAA
jgi:peptide/nickel transport system permease protein